MNTILCDGLDSFCDFAIRSKSSVCREVEAAGDAIDNPVAIEGR
jgi:hypothetical protein